MIGLSTNITSRLIATGGLAAPVSLTINDGAGNVIVLLSEGGSVDVSVGDGPTVTIVDQPGTEDIGFVYAPSFTGTVSVGADLIVDLGIVYFQGEGPVTVEQDILRNGTVIVAGIRASTAPQTYTYRVDALDVGQSVQVRSRLTNGANVLEVLTDLVRPTDMQITAAGAHGWYDFSDTATISIGGGGLGDEIAVVLDKSGAGNALTQPNTSLSPRRVDGQVNGRTMAQFGDNDILVVPDMTVRSMFFVLSALDGRSAGISPVLGTNTQDVAGPHQHIFVRDSDLTDYDISVDGAVANSGTVYIDTGASGSGGNISLSGLAAAERQGTRLWYVEMNQDLTPVDAIGFFRSGSNTYAHSGTLFGEVVLFPTALTTAQANGVAHEIAGRWGLTWTDIS